MENDRQEMPLSSGGFKCNKRSTWIFTVLWKAFLVRAPPMRRLGIRIGSTINGGGEFTCHTISSIRNHCQNQMSVPRPLTGRRYIDSYGKECFAPLPAKPPVLTMRPVGKVAHSANIHKTLSIILSLSSTEESVFNYARRMWGLPQDAILAFHCAWVGAFAR